MAKRKQKFDLSEVPTQELMAALRARSEASVIILKHNYNSPINDDLPKGLQVRTQIEMHPDAFVGLAVLGDAVVRAAGAMGSQHEDHDGDDGLPYAS